MLIYLTEQRTRAATINCLIDLMSAIKLVDNYYDNHLNDFSTFFGKKSQSSPIPAS